MQYTPVFATPALPRTTRARMRRAFATVVAAAALTVAGFAATSPAYAHDELVGFTLNPNMSDSPTEPPTGFTLQFSNELTNMGAEVIAVDTNDNSIAEGDPQLSGRELTQQFTSDLSDGEYRITWKVVSSDGHPISGALQLNVAAGSPAELTTATFADHAQSGAAENADGSTTHEPGEPQATAETPAWLTPAAIIAGIAVIGAVGAVMIRKFRAHPSAPGQNGHSADRGDA